MSQWFVSRQGKLKGPYSLPQLQDLVKAGDLKPVDLVCPAGGAPALASRVPGLFPEPTAVKAAPVKAAPVKPSPRPRPIAPAEPILAEPIEAAPAPAPAPRAEKAARRPRTQEPVAPSTPWTLPKPVLFALCGACGGLLAAIFLGEPAFYLAKPSLVKNEPGIRLAVPKSMDVYVGGRQRFSVKIGRDFWKGPVILELKDPPSGVSAATVMIPDGPGEADAPFDVAVDRALAAGTYPLQVVARADGAGNVRSAVESLELRAVRLPASLAMEVSPEVDVFQGGKNRFKICIARSHFDGEVQLRLSEAPPGVVFPAVTIPVGANEAEVELAVADGTPVGSSSLAIVAEAADGSKDLRATKNSTLTIRPRPMPMVDVLFVLDLTSSMTFAIKGIKTGIGDFADGLRANHIDFQVGLIGFRDIEADREEPFVLLPGTFTQDPDTLRNAVDRLTARGGGDIPESSLQALDFAAKQSFRRDSKRVLLLITDACPKVHLKIARPPYSIKDTVDILRSAHIDQLHLVVRDKDFQGFGLHADPKNPYKQFLSKYNALGFQGEFFDITKVSRDGATFAKILPDLGKSISTLTKATPPANPPVKAPPALPPAAASALLPPPAEVRGLPAVASTQAYDESSGTRLVFAMALWSAIIAAGISLLISVGQRFYLRKGLLQLTASGKAIGGGVLAGLIGGATVQLFVQATAGGAAWESLSRIIGWSVLGSLAGLGMALVVPNLKSSRGLLGGAIGGFLGAVAFLIISFATRGMLGAFGDAFGRLAGATVLGFCIGLMVALAELAFRQRWLEITFGTREIRTVTLGNSAVTVGGDDKLASVYVSGLAPIALRFHVEKDTVFCQDVANGVTREVMPGVKQRLGNVTIAVCTSTTANKSGYTLELSSGASIPLAVGMPLTAADLPGLEAQGADGMVSLLSPKPSDPTKLLLRNRSKQTWKAQAENGEVTMIDPGRGIELASAMTIDFGPTKGTIVHD